VVGFSFREVSSMEMMGPVVVVVLVVGLSLDKGSLLVGRAFRRVLIAVRDWATVSAMPPRTWRRS
jgi:hypothetical protein